MYTRQLIFNCAADISTITIQVIETTTACTGTSLCQISTRNIYTVSNTIQVIETTTACTGASSGSRYLEDYISLLY